MGFSESDLKLENQLQAYEKDEKDKKYKKKSKALGRLNETIKHKKIEKEATELIDLKKPDPLNEFGLKLKKKKIEKAIAAKVKKEESKLNEEKKTDLTKLSVEKKVSADEEALQKAEFQLASVIEITQKTDPSQKKTREYKAHMTNKRNLVAKVKRMKMKKAIREQDASL